MINNGTSIIKLYNFFKSHNEIFEISHENHHYIQVLSKVFNDTNENNIFMLYPVLFKQIDYSFNYIRSKRHNEKTVLDLEQKVRGCINNGKRSLFLHKKQIAPIVLLEKSKFELLETYAHNAIDNISEDSLYPNKADIDDLLKKIQDLISAINEKESVNYEDKLYFTSLLEKMIFIIKNNDKLSVENELLGDASSIYSMCEINNILNEDSAFKEKILNFTSKVFSVFPKIYWKAKLDLNLINPNFMIEVSNKK